MRGFSEGYQEMLKQYAEAKLIEPSVDPHNPWPVGCEWWHQHNEMWQRDRSRRAFKRRILS